MKKELEFLIEKKNEKTRVIRIINDKKESLSINREELKFIVKIEKEMIHHD